MPKDQTYRIQLFGPFALSGLKISPKLPPLAAGAARSLLAYLVLNRSAPVAREKLLGVLWPDESDARARRALSQALWQVRRSLPPDALLADGPTLSINPNAPLTSDVAEFDQLANPYLPPNPCPPAALPALRQAAQLVHGELLEGQYDDWLLLPRERYNERTQLVLEALVTLEKQASNYANALDYALQLAAQDPLRDSLQREIMRLYYQLDRPADALRQFEHFCGLMQRELNSDPEPATHELAQEIAARSGQPEPAWLPARTAPEPTLLPLVGRETERSQLLQSIESTLNGQGGIALLAGEPGIGKTRLLQEIARDAEWRGGLVLWGQCQPGDSQPPYGPLTLALQSGLTRLRADQLSQLVQPIWLATLSPLLPTLAEWLPDLPPPPTNENPDRNREQLSSALLLVLQAWAKIAPLTLILEDLHWADDDTLSVLTAMAHPLQNGPALLVCSFREGEARARPEHWQTLSQLSQSGIVQQIKLSGLTPTASALLIRRSLNAATGAPAFEQHLHEETGGNPLFLLETLRNLQQANLLTRSADGTWHTPYDANELGYHNLPLAPRIEAVIESRLATLDSQAVAVLSAAAILGNTFTFSVLVQASNIPANTAIQALNTLQKAHFIAEKADAYQFHHDLVRQAALNRLSATEQQQLYARAAEWLSHQPQTDAALLASYHEAAGNLNAAYTQHQAAAQQARQAYALRTALRHLKAALRLGQATQQAPDLLFDLLLEIERTQQLLGLSQERQASLAQLAELATTPQQHHHLVLRQATVDIEQGDYQAATERLEPAYAHATKPQARYDLALLFGRCKQSFGRGEEAAALLTQALELAATDRQRIEALKSLGASFLDLKRYQQAEEILRQALNFADASQDAITEVDILSTLAVIALEQGQFEPAEASMQQAIQIAERVGYQYGLARNATNLGNLYSYSKKIEKSLALYQKATEIFALIGFQRGEAIVNANIASHYITHLDDIESAKPYLAIAHQYYLSVEDPIGLAQTYGLLGLTFPNQEKGITYLEKAVSIAREAQDGWMGAQGYRNLIISLLDLNQPDRALTHALNAIELCQTVNLPTLLPALYSLTARTLAMLERCNEAQPYIYQTYEQIPQATDQEFLIWHWLAIAHQLCQQPDLQQAAAIKAYESLVAEISALDTDTRERLLHTSSVFKPILEMYYAIYPPENVVQLSDAHGNLITVRWVANHPDDAKFTSKVAQRQTRLARLLATAAEQGAAPTNAELAALFDVSLPTIERDRAALRTQK